MRIVSVNVGLPRVVAGPRGPVRTGIFKEPVDRPVALRGFNLDGDGQADLSVHGGRDKAVYAYPHEHYAYWGAELPGRDLRPGHFGENLTTEGLLEDEVAIGDEFRVGTAALVATQPRMPCHKLGLRFGDPGMVRRFLLGRRPGIYFAVVEEGTIGPGDRVEPLRRDGRRVTVADVLRLIAFDRLDRDGLRRALEVPALAEVWRAEFTDRLEALGGLG